MVDSEDVNLAVRIFEALGLSDTITLTLILNPILHFKINSKGIEQSEQNNFD